MYKITTTLLSPALLLLVVTMGETISKQNDSDYISDYLELRQRLDSNLLDFMI